MQEPRPTLHTSYRGYRRGLLGSFLIALVASGALFASLTLISMTVKILASEDQIPLTVHSEREQVSPEKTKPFFEPSPAKPQAPSRIHAPKIQAVAPSLVIYVPPVSDSLPEMDYELDELDLENPFIEKAKPKKAIQKRIAKKATKAKSKTSAAQARRRAALAKKIINKAAVTSRAKPTYPKSARRKKQQGRVIVTVTVGTSGKVTSSHVSQSSSIASLDSAALRAARKFRFKPARNGLGQAVPTKKRLPFNFKLTS